MHIILIAGLPGSGKTYLANEIAQKRNGIVVDDPIALDFPTAKLLIITDPMFCYSSTRVCCEDALKKLFKDATIEWIFFENDPEQCQKNASSRSDKDVHSFIKMASKIYEVPENYNSIPVWK